jgi:hypothetical protein
VTLASRYGDAVLETLHQYPSPELLPFALVKACVLAFPVAGAGLSATEGLRVPLAASDDVVARAERLQTTLGEGPCLAAAQRGTGAVTDLETLRQTWPVFCDQIVGLTPYRSIASVPLLGANGSALAALDLYSTDPSGDAFEAIADLQVAIAQPAAALLLAAPMTTGPDGVEMPAWFDTDAASSRMDVWVAVGMLMARSAFSNDDALSALRAYAYSRDLTVDEVAFLLLTRVLLPSDI